MIGDLLGLAGSAATGGLLGAGLSIIKQGVGMFAASRERKHEIALEKVRAEAGATAQIGSAEAEARAAGAEARAREAEAAAREAVADSAALTAGIEAQAAAGRTIAWDWLRSIVEAIKALIRPTITIYFALMLPDLIEAVADHPALLELVIHAVLFVATTSLTFWFSDRPLPQRKP